MPDPLAVNSMFGRIAPRYDLANRVLSGGIDVYWRFRLVQAVHRARPRNVLDLATGSGDVVFALQRALPAGTQLLGMDFCPPMLDQAERKQAAHPSPKGPIVFQPGDALALPLPDESYDAVTIAFGLRNLADRAKGLAEMRRVLRPGGSLFILEFSQAWPLVRPLAHLHIHRVAPALAGWLTGDRAAYEYLGTSIAAFPGREALSAEIRSAGFAAVSAAAMTMGVVALHTARR